MYTVEELLDLANGSNGSNGRRNVDETRRLPLGDIQWIQVRNFPVRANEEKMYTDGKRRRIFVSF